VDREQVVELVRDTVVGTKADQSVAERVVEALENRDLLKSGERRRWHVVVDDPEASRAYEYDVEAYSAHAASIKAARLAIREDPGGCMVWPKGQQPTEEQRAHMADGGLAELVARYAVAVELGGVAGFFADAPF
jgi:hypothetical protein